MDCFLCDGIEVIFRLALSLLMIGKPELLVQDMEGVIRVRDTSRFYVMLDLIQPILSLQYFQKEMPVNFENDPESVFNMAYSLKINQKKMKKLEKDYTTMKTKEKEDEIELRVRILNVKCVPSMIHSARPIVPPVVITTFT